MRHLFLVRHGDYCNDNRLSSLGRDQMRVLGANIKTILDERPAVIISSTAPRALDSSEVLMKELNLTEFEREPLFWTSGDSPICNHFASLAYYPRSALDVTVDYIEQKGQNTENLIIVSHEEITRSIPGYFLARVWEKQERIAHPQKGQGIHFDCQSRLYQMIPKD